MSTGPAPLSALLEHYRTTYDAGSAGDGQVRALLRSGATELHMSRLLESALSDDMTESNSWADAVATPEQLERTSGRAARLLGDRNSGDRRELGSRPVRRPRRRHEYARATPSELAPMIGAYRELTTTQLVHDAAPTS